MQEKKRILLDDVFEQAGGDETSCTNPGVGLRYEQKLFIVMGGNAKTKEPILMGRCHSGSLRHSFLIFFLLKLHKFAHHPCAAAMLISVSFQ